MFCAPGSHTIQKGNRERESEKRWRDRERKREGDGENIGVVLVANPRFAFQQCFRMPVRGEGDAGLNSQYFSAPPVPY